MQEHNRLLFLIIIIANNDNDSSRQLYIIRALKCMQTQKKRTRLFSVHAFYSIETNEFQLIFECVDM